MNKALDTARLSGKATGLRIEIPEPSSRLAASFAELGEKFGFSHFLLTTFPRGDQIGFSENLLASNWPAAVLEDYVLQDVFGISALNTTLKTTVLPVYAGADIFLREGDQSDSFGLAARLVQAGLRQTLAFSLHDACLNHYIVALSGVRPAPSRLESMEIVYDSLTLLDEQPAATRPQAPREKLTGREIECLRWSAAGKSSEEIAIILAISSHTVVSYLKSAMRKLDAVNRMQAIARACRYRLL
jgi:DNA-binding CsgD family transcriptional regulator